jgi:hypothetical protein
MFKKRPLVQPFTHQTFTQKSDRLFTCKLFDDPIKLDVFEIEVLIHLMLFMEQNTA